MPSSRFQSFRISMAIALATLALAGCSDESDPVPAPAPVVTAADVRLTASSFYDVNDPALSTSVPAPEDPVAKLGMQLFFSKTLGGDFDVACASCHMPDLGGGDRLSLSVGVDAVTPAFLGPGRRLDVLRDRDPQADGGPNVPRNAQTVFNVALYNRAMFHDGRVFVLDAAEVPGGMGQSLRTTDSELAIEDITLPPDFGMLEAQALFPVTSTNEMRGRHRFSNLLTNADVRARLVARLRGEADLDHMPRNDWAPLFRDAFGYGAGDPVSSYVTYENVARAIAAYERSQLFVDTPWQAFMAGDDNAISDAAKRGAQIFYREPAANGAGCARCHSGAHFTDEEFRAVGFPQIGRGKRVDRRDLGRYAVVQDPANLFRYRTPSLLNVALTAPYGHAGTFDTLEEVVAYHADTPTAATLFDFTFSTLDQFINDTVTYPLAAPLTGEAMYVDEARTVLRLDAQLPAVSLTAGQRADLVAFLHALTDTCAADNACLERWVPTPADDPDGNQFVRSFDPDAGRPADPLDLFNGPPGTGSGPGGSGGGSGSGDPAHASVFLAGRSLCSDRIGETATGGGFNDSTAALGITHTHAFSLLTWLEPTLEDTLQSGGVAAADLDGDCDHDLVFTGGEAQGTLVYRNDDSAGFALAANLDTLTGSRLTGPAIADLDGDYQPEILLGNMRPGLMQVLDGNIDDGYGLLQAIYMANNTFGIAMGDADGDARLDVFAAHWDNRRATDASAALLHNDPVNGLVSMDAAAGTSASTIPRRFQFAPAFVDIDDDNDQDLLVAADFLFSLVLANDGSGHYTSITDRDVIKDQNGMGAAIADFDGDGKLDWFVSAIKGPDDFRIWPYGTLGNRLYRGLGAGQFADVTDTAGVGDADWAWGSCASDFNNDGRPDLFVVAGYALFPDLVRNALGTDMVAMIDAMFAGYFRSVPRLWLNNGDGTFSDEAAAWGITEPLNGRGVSCLDHDRDGDVDIVVSQNEDSPRVYENRSGTAGGRNFLAVSLRGTAPNTAGIGAMVDLSSASRDQRQPVAANSNFISQNPPDLHFGLGNDSEATITVRWPDGTVTTTGPVPANRFLVISHPDLMPALVDAGQATLDAAALRTQAWLMSNPPTNPQALLDLWMISQRFGLSFGSGAATDFDAWVASLYGAGDIAAAQTQELYRRIYDSTQTANAAYFTATGTDALLLPALYCRELATDVNYPTQLAAAGTAGGSSALAALRAVILLRENGCNAGLRPAQLAIIENSVAALFNTGDNSMDVSDIEAAALLAAIGRTEMVSATWISQVLATELATGGWALSAPLDNTVGLTANSPPTTQALWLLLELAGGSNNFNPLVAMP